MAPAAMAAASSTKPGSNEATPGYIK